MDRDFIDTNVEQFPQLPGRIVPPPPDIEQPSAPQLELRYVRVVNIAMSVLSLRILAVIALLGAVVMFGYAVIDPLPWRLYAAVSYAIVVLLPIIYLYLKREH